MNFFSKIFLALSLVGTASVVPFLDILSFLFKTVDPKFIQTVNITKCFLSIILGLFAVGFSQLFIRWSKLNGFAGSIPNHLTALGILGTFVGIFLGLYNFKVGNLQTSIPCLLEGMKLAFTTSIAGLTTSTLLRVSHSVVISISDKPDPFYPPPNPEDSETVVVFPGFEDLKTISQYGFSELSNKLKTIISELEKNNIKSIKFEDINKISSKLDEVNKISSKLDEIVQKIK